MSPIAGIILSFCLTGCIFLPLSVIFADTSYRVSSGSEREIKEHNVQWKVRNSCSSDIFVPTRTSAEWSAFIANKPSCLQFTAIPVGACGSAAGIPSRIMPAANLCRAGIPSAVAPREADFNWRWTCGGAVTCTSPHELVSYQYPRTYKGRAECAAAGGVPKYGLDPGSTALYCNLCPGNAGGGCVGSNCPGGWNTYSWIKCSSDQCSSAEQLNPANYRYMCY